MHAVNNKVERVTSQERFPIVGIGASAGGLEAVGELIQALPADTGMAFIFVQHLSPARASILTEILSKKTTMPVADAVQGQPVVPNHIYIIPPNATLTIAQGCLCLKTRDDAFGAPMPIDDLFHSLAEDQGANAIGISLSGSGSDGALGMQSIKNEGGITFAQDAKSAQYSSMPHAAMALGCIDFVLPPTEIAQELARIGRLPAQSATLGDEHEKDLEKIFQRLQKTCGLDFSHYKRGTIKRRLARRLALQNLGTIPDYIKFINHHPDELKLLCQDFLIRVTSFFRDPETFENLTKHVFPCIEKNLSPKTPLRIWIPGCSTGEEVYSIAICCLEYLADRGIGTPVQIFGTDVNEAALQTARTGVYVENIARNVSPERLEKFFTKNNAHYQISKSVRDLCIFARHDVTRDPPFSHVDLVSCRNLLIYLDAQLQKRVLPMFHYALKPGGILILGPAENIGSFSDIFTPAGNKEIKFYAKKPLLLSSQLKYLQDYAGKPDIGTHTRANTDHALLASGKKYPEAARRKQNVDRIIFDHYVPPGVLCDKNLDVIEFHGDTGDYLSQPPGPTVTNLQKLAKPGLLVKISKAVKQAGKDGLTVKRTGLSVETGTGNRKITLDVIPVQQHIAGEPLFLVFFAGAESAVAPARRGFWAAPGGDTRANLKERRGPRRSRDDDELHRIKRELAETHDHIRAMIEEYAFTKEELQASREELLSSNEEFQSTNEELETAKEELQSANEELLTANEETSYRNRELNELNDRLQRALSYAETIIKTVNQPFLVLDGDLHILRANSAFYKTFKTTPQTTEHRLLYDLGDRQWDIPELHSFLRALLLRDTSFKDYEITHIFPNIGKKTMRLNGTHLIWKEKVQILLAIEDVSDYRSALDTLKDNDRHKDEFLAMLAHELRNPLAPIRNALEVWKRGDAGPKIEKKSQIIMGRQIQKIIRLVDDLLDVSRITRGAIVLKKETIDLGRLIGETIESSRPHFKARRHRLSWTPPKEKIFVRGDTIRLEQVMTNLLGNAAKYTEPGGRIAVKLQLEDDSALIQVLDNGMGIAPELLPYIFDLFIQADRSLDRKQGGLGIGLTIVRRLLELHGGSIDAKSEGENKGSEFLVRLPVTSGADMPAAPEPSPAPKTEPLLGRRVLIIDDSADASLTTQMLLELRGHQVETALDGPAGIKLAQSFKPEVILLDIGLPGMDGYEVAHCLRSLPETKDVLLIALSGYGQKEDFVKSKRAGFNHHLVKPADTDKLQNLIAR